MRGPRKSWRSRCRRAGKPFRLAAVLAVAVTSSGCITVVLGKPLPCPTTEEAADFQLNKLYRSGHIVPGDPVFMELAENERYCNYIDRLRGDF